MAQAHADARLGSRPALRRAASPGWVSSQAAARASDRHPLYDLLEYPAAEPGIEQFLDGLERAASQRLRGVAARAARLTNGSSTDYWAAVDELSVLCRLSSCALEAVLDEVPDIVVDPSDDRLNLELTAPARTPELERLCTDLLAALTTDDHVTLNLGRVTWRPISAERRVVVQRTLDAIAAGIDEVDLSGVVSSTRLTVTIVPSDRPSVATASDVDFGGYNPVPDLEETVERKRRQLRSLPHVVVGVNVDRLDYDAVTFALRSRLRSAYGGGGPLDLHAASNVVGVVWFCRASPCDPPMFAGWIENVDFVGTRPPRLPALLECLGAALTL